MKLQKKNKKYCLIKKKKKKKDKIYSRRKCLSVQYSIFNYMRYAVHAVASVVFNSVTLWTGVSQAPLSMGLPKQ